MKPTGVTVEGIQSLTLALLSLAPVAQTTANRSIGDWATAEEDRIKAAARRVDAQARMASRSVRAARGQGGRITAGGPGRLHSGGSFGDVFFGAEFGGGAHPSTRQFRPYRSRGYWFFPTVEKDETTTLLEAAEDGLDAAADRWAD